MDNAFTQYESLLNRFDRSNLLLWTETMPNLADRSLAIREVAIDYWDKIVTGVAEYHSSLRAFPITIPMLSHVVINSLICGTDLSYNDRNNQILDLHKNSSYLDTTFQPLSRNLDIILTHLSLGVYTPEFIIEYLQETFGPQGLSFVSREELQDNNWGIFLMIAPIVEPHLTTATNQPFLNYFYDIIPSCSRLTGTSVHTHFMLCLYLAGRYCFQSEAYERRYRSNAFTDLMGALFYQNILLSTNMMRFPREAISTMPCTLIHPSLTNPMADLKLVKQFAQKKNGIGVIATGFPAKYYPNFIDLIKKLSPILEQTTQNVRFSGVTITIPTCEVLLYILIMYITQKMIQNASLQIYILWESDLCSNYTGTTPVKNDEIRYLLYPGLRTEENLSVYYRTKDKQAYLQNLYEDSPESLFTPPYFEQLENLACGPARQSPIGAIIMVRGNLLLHTLTKIRTASDHYYHGAMDNFIDQSIACGYNSYGVNLCTEVKSPTRPGMHTTCQIGNVNLGMLAIPNLLVLLKEAGTPMETIIRPLHRYTTLVASCMQVPRLYIEARYIKAFRCTYEIPTIIQCGMGYSLLSTVWNHSNIDQKDSINSVYHLLYKHFLQYYNDEIGEEVHLYYTQRLEREVPENYETLVLERLAQYKKPLFLTGQPPGSRNLSVMRYESEVMGLPYPAYPVVVRHSVSQSTLAPAAPILYLLTFIADIGDVYKIWEAAKSDNFSVLEAYTPHTKYLHQLTADNIADMVITRLQYIDQALSVFFIANPNEDFKTAHQAVMQKYHDAKACTLMYYSILTPAGFM